MLYTVGVAASKLKRKSANKHVGKCYHGLCRLLSTTLVRHRKKLGGRYHLLVRALQSLLRCLFVPYSATGSPSSDKAKPSRELPLEAGHAAAYARVLVALCDPMVSAVSRSRHSSREELNDESKKARTIAGQHIQYLVEDFCECQLKGRLEPEMRAALSPGLNAALTIMPQEVMRNLNAAMGSASRAMFKALYDDYKRSR